jgi:hypothetical protein
MSENIFGEYGDIHGFIRYLIRISPSALTVSGMLLYSFIMFICCGCMRKIKNQALYPRIAKSMGDASNKQRA